MPDCHGPFLSFIVSDLIFGRENLFAAAHAPTRVTPSALGAFLRERVLVVANVAEYVTGGEVAALEALNPGEGAVVRQVLSKVTADRDEAGGLHLRSAVCTHVGCIVHWNPFERCWDCPCHSSQLVSDGTALNGPAIHPLAAVAAPEGTGS